MWDCPKKKWIKSLKNKQSLLRVSYYMVGYQHGDPWLCPDRESLECLLHVSQLLLPPTTSSRMVLASVVTAMSLSAESQHCDSPGNLRRTQYLLELTCFVYSILILPLAHTHQQPSWCISSRSLIFSRWTLSCCHWSELVVTLIWF